MADFNELANRLRDAEQLTQKAADALRLYREAVDTEGDPKKVEQLRQDAEFLMQALSDFQLQVLGLAERSLQ